MRTSSIAGKIQTKAKDSIGFDDLELKGPSCLQALCYKLTCTRWAKERSYLRVRENSIESNWALHPCSCLPCTWACDSVYVAYFDRAPFVQSCLAKTCCCLLGGPNIRIVEPGMMICCQKCECKCCCAQQAVVSPCDKFCLCACPNEVCWLHNWCGFCGPIDGNPLCFLPFRPAPLDPQVFKTSANRALGWESQAGATPKVAPAQHDMPVGATGEKS
eukprot:TRINITY_DN19390_c0_g1_i1.p1 TRINITY_DN19390_c0_g1~~TRINITY_DN19390_c0_g1_i1.p1  ORF type:complete len:217 (+),score=17.95 TRINITY_DN19390_c0_g1_i1:68-718(+)